MSKPLRRMYEYAVLHALHRDDGKISANCGPQVRNPLDPLLQKLSREYTDDADLSRRIQDYFHVMIINKKYLK